MRPKLVLCILIKSLKNLWMGIIHALQLGSNESQKKSLHFWICSKNVIFFLFNLGFNLAVGEILPWLEVTLLFLKS